MFTQLKNLYSQKEDDARHRFVDDEVLYLVGSSSNCIGIVVQNVCRCASMSWCTQVMYMCMYYVAHMTSSRGRMIILLAILLLYVLIRTCWYDKDGWHATKQILPVCQRSRSAARTFLGSGDSAVLAAGLLYICVNGRVVYLYCGMVHLRSYVYVRTPCLMSMKVCTSVTFAEISQDYFAYV